MNKTNVVNLNQARVQARKKKAKKHNVIIQEAPLGIVNRFFIRLSRLAKKTSAFFKKSLKK